MIKRTFKVTDMHCSNCAMRIESLEDELPGLKSIAASYARAQVVVEYDERLLEEERIIEAIKEKGYTVGTG